MNPRRLCSICSLLILVVGLFALLAGASSAARAERPEWKVGLAAMKITPEEPLWMIGYASRPRFQPSTGVLNDLYAKAMAIESADGQQAVLISVDLCVFRAPLARAVVQRISAQTGLAPQQILVCLSHTHSGPLLGYESVDTRFPMSESEKQQTIEYTHQMVGKLAHVSDLALGDLRPARLSCGVGEVNFVVNRRRLDAQGNYRGMGPYAAGDVDRSVPVLRVDSPDGQARAVVFGCACHNVTLGPANLKYSGDFSGFAAEAIERTMPGVQAMFVAGCAADANPHPRSTKDQERVVKRQGEQLAAEVVRIAEGPRREIHGPLKVARREVPLPLSPVPAVEELKKMATGPVWQSYNARRMLDALERGQELPTTYTAPLGVWRFGSDLTLIALSGEVGVDYVRLLEEQFENQRLWIAAYCNEVFGYLPSRRILAEGGYETRGLAGHSIGFFAPEVQQILVREIKQLAGETRAKAPVE